MASLGKQIAMSAKNVASDFYNGAVKGVKKADFTVNKVIKKNQMPTNLNNAASKKAMLNTLKAQEPNRTNKELMGAGIKLKPDTSTKLDNAKYKAKMTYNNNSIGAKAGNFIGSGTRSSIDAYKQMGQNDKSILKAIQQGHKKADGPGYDMKKIAGTAVGVGVAGRIATGGGLYRDRYGNVNVPGVPFI